MVLGVVIRILAGEGRLEQDGSLQAEALQVGVKQLAGRVHPGSLEGVARNHGGVSVIYQTTQHSQTTTPYRFFLKILSAKLFLVSSLLTGDPLESSEPGSGLRESLSNLLRLV